MSLQSQKQDKLKEKSALDPLTSFCEVPGHIFDYVQLNKDDFHGEVQEGTIRRTGQPVAVQLLPLGSKTTAELQVATNCTV